MGIRIALLAGLLLAGCGYKGSLSRLEPRPEGVSREAHSDAKARERARVEQGLTPPAIAQPLRVDDISVKLEVRRDDPFALPPEGTKGAVTPPFPGDIQRKTKPSTSPQTSQQASQPAASNQNNPEQPE